SGSRRSISWIACARAHRLPRTLARAWRWCAGSTRAAARSARGPRCTSTPGTARRVERRSHSMPPWVHPTATVEAGASLGEGTRVWHFCHVMPGARIGADSVLGQNCFVASGVSVGDRVRVQNNVSLYEGVELEDEVFCGPSVVFTNVKHPRAFISRRQ